MFIKSPSIMYLMVLTILFVNGCSNEIDTVVINSPLHIGSLFAVNGNRAVTLGWTGVENGTAKMIQIHRSMDMSFTPSTHTVIASLAPTATTYIDSTVINNQQYFYRIVPADETSDGILRFGTAEEATPARPYDYTGVSTIKFSEHIQPIFLSGCAVSGCHVGDSHNDHELAKQSAFNKTAHTGEFSLKEWDDFFTGGNHGAIVIPYKGNKSHITFHINTDTLLGPVSLPHMPPLASFNIPTDQLQLIRRWIDEGAPNDFGSVAFSVHPQGKVLVTNQAEDLVAVIDRSTDLVARYIQAGVPNVFIQPPNAPHNVTVDKAHGYYYVNLISAGKVLKYRLSDNAKISEVSGVISPTQIALSSTGDTGYVAQFASGVNAIKLFNTQTMQIIGQVSALYLDKPHGVQLTPDARELWVTGNLSDNIVVVDLEDFSTSLIQLNNQAPGTGGILLPYQTVMTPDNKFVYVSCQGSNEVRVISRDSLKIVKVIPVGQWPLILAISPDGQYVYSANRNSNDVSVIRTSTDSVVTTIFNVGPGPHGIDITADGLFAYVSCENVIAAIPPHHPTSGSKIPGLVTVIDLMTNQVIKEIEVGAFAAGVAIVE